MRNGVTVVFARGRSVFVHIRLFETEDGLQFGGGVHFYSSDRNLKYSCAISIRIFNEVNFLSPIICDCQFYRLFFFL